MDRMPKIGRNDPCPCGSGKKYKRCCGTRSQSYGTRRKEIDFFKLNRDIAYEGKIGGQRRNFCIRYIEQKREIFKVIEKEQLKFASSKGKNITCRKGCSFCCAEYVEATLQEAEAIVYYLYQNEGVLEAFLQAYPIWREKVQESGDSFKRMSQLWTTRVNSENLIEVKHLMDSELDHYRLGNIPCPFLRDDICSIYQVRPVMCASLFATTLPQWCNPSNPNRPMRGNCVETAIMQDSSFYHRNLKQPIISFMPIMVYEILKGGFMYLSGIPDLEDIEDKAMNDPEVKPILRQYF